MKVTLIGQGYDATSQNSVGSCLIKFFSSEDFHSFTGISAFTSQAGISGLSKYIKRAKKHLRIITIVTGVDQKGTSKEALLELLNLDINAFIFYQPSFTIFHPKIYLFEGDDRTELLIGSSNLTAQGLFTNVETSLLVSIDNSIESDRKKIEQLKNYFKGIFDSSDPNLKPLSKALIDDLVKAKLVPTEAERKVIQDKGDKSERKETENIILKLFPKRAIAKIPGEFRGKRKTKSKEEAEKPKAIPAVTSKIRGRLVWTRRKLPASSVQIGREINTNPTGGLRLVQDDFVSDGQTIDHPTYFRNQVFGKSKWKQVKINPLVETTTVPFEVTVKGKYLGSYNLEVRHKPSGEAKQRNYTTSISWGNLGGVILKANLSGARLDLYAPKSKRKPFNIVIS